MLSTKSAHCASLGKTPNVVELRAEPLSVRRARSFVRRALDERGVALETRDTMVLLASELATNAIEHGGPPTGRTVLIFLFEQDCMLRLEVHDTERRVPVLRSGDGVAESGRGLLVVTELATRWGIVATAAGKYVFCELPVSGER